MVEMARSLLVVSEVDCHRIMQGSNDWTMASTNVPLYIRGWIYTILILIYIYTLYICIIYYRVSWFYLCVSPASGMDGFSMQSHNFCLMKRVRRSFFCLQHLEHLSIHTFVGRICYEILWMRTFRTFRTSLIELDWILHNLLCRALNFRTQEVTPGTSADTANGQAAVATGNPRESHRLLMGIIYWLMPTSYSALGITKDQRMIAAIFALFFLLMQILSKFQAIATWPAMDETLTEGRWHHLMHCPWFEPQNLMKTGVDVGKCWEHVRF